MFDAPHTISQLTTYIRELFETNTILQNVWVTGEVSNMTRASSGHWYFTLKDKDAQLRCVMWRSNTVNQSITPRNGDAIEAYGHVGVYEPRGEYQLYTDRVRSVGLGDLHIQFEQLKAQLAEEGLFDADHKREPPSFPRKMGVVTSVTAAAFQDVLNVLRRRYPIAEVILSPTQVQGEDAPRQIIQAIRRLNEYTDVDIILLCRGGGSIEDLWAFNNEEVARTVASSRVPIITGVGHETDFTIVDFVSDDRAPTPSAAAEHATPDIEELEIDLRMLSERLDGMMYDILLNKGILLNTLIRTMTHVSPINTILNSRQRVDDLGERLMHIQKSQLNLLKERLESRTASLNAANPKAILNRGYAIVTRSEDGRRVLSELDVTPGTGITLQLKDGELKARVEDKDSHERYRRTLF